MKKQTKIPQKLSLKKVSIVNLNAHKAALVLGGDGTTSLVSATTNTFENGSSKNTNLSNDGVDCGTGTLR